MYTSGKNYSLFTTVYYYITDYKYPSNNGVPYEQAYFLGDSISPR